MRLKTIISILLTLSLFNFSAFKKDKKRPDSSQLVFIPLGSMNMDDRVYTLDAFWMLSTEVSNKEYNLFLNDLKTSGKTKDYEMAKVRNECWNMLKISFYKPLSQFYHTHPAYENYPVVGITKEGARLYCEWLSTKSENKYKYRLPSRVEWIYAARGGLDSSDYPWGGKNIRNIKGDFLCNFRQIGDENIHYVDSLDTYTVAQFTKVGMTVPTGSYLPNEFGLYDVSGNVAEMVDEEGIAMGGSWDSPGYDVRVTSKMIWEGTDPRVGFRVVRDYISGEK
ncbi:MAG: SUMF1/EgtB/PvdO family nonheme iron enzyme [Bacteroidales bacterium]|nr:SUMF1/EgtB/PvdO family nonheme iron enzyme [Bacteroidales bacterium]